MENTTQTNAVNDTLKDIQKMVDIVKRDGEVSLSYMKGLERDTIMYEKGQEAERQNTERERQRADSAEKARMIAEEEKINNKRAYRYRYQKILSPLSDVTHLGGGIL